MAKIIFYALVCETRVRYACESICKAVDKCISTPIHQLLDDCGVIAFSDRENEYWGMEYMGRKVIPPHEICNSDYDKIIVLSYQFTADIYDDLTKKHGIPGEKIETYQAEFVNNTREKFVFQIAAILKSRNISGAVAEGGVYRGNFSRIINMAFPESSFYLFDTFEGFDTRDFVSDKKFMDGINMRTYFNETSVNFVLNRLPYSEKAIVKKGFFPETAVDINDSFVFVNLDFDLYAPIKAGLEFFYPKMVKGGVILIHDYYCKNFDTCKAVDEFCSEHGLFLMPIGDVLSVAIIKQ